MRKLTRWLALTALALVLVAGLGRAIAYFTTYVVAIGDKPIVLNGETTIREEFGAWTKHVNITAASDSSPVFVRARAYGDEGLVLQYSSDGSWSQDGDWWYYADVLQPGETARELLVKIDNVPKTPGIEDTIQVVVVQECTPARYRADGTAYADWNDVAGGVTP